MSKLIFLLKDKESTKKVKYEVSQFFNIQIKPGIIEEINQDGNNYMMASALEIVHPSMVESIQQGIDQINTSKFDIVAI